MRVTGARKVEFQTTGSTKAAMFRCHVGGKTESRQALVSEIFDFEGKPVQVERIPATVCLRCGEPVFSRDATERVRRMVHGEAKPIKSIQMDVLACR
jgi:YgiT-type zinc finger domain-containing protein